MESKGQYKTKQLRELITYLETIPHVHVTVNDLKEYFERSGKAIGTATLYRHLERMTDEGIVRKYIIDETSSACYEYIGEQKVCHEVNCFHCKCKLCGRLIHIQSNELNDISHLLLTKHNFSVDLQQTVFYGICDACSSTTYI
ncbi:MAG: transcriptional repressor [Oscillospiraceae bacterium]|nr:transcriptional repressor [Oscillospiraceae bacterium]